MLTFFNIENRIGSTPAAAFFGKLRGNSVRSELCGADGVALRKITYVCRNGTVDFSRIAVALNGQLDGVLCPEELILPENAGFTRFENRGYKRRMACNLALRLLKGLYSRGRRVGVALYDPEGHYKGLLPALIRMTGDVLTVTDCTPDYEKVCTEIADETGVSVRLTENRSPLGGRALIIAPEQIRERLPLSSGAVVLSGFEPSEPVPGLVYYRYHLRVPERFRRIKPESLSAEYFLGALYSKAHRRELGELVPFSCGSSASIQTVSSIIDYLENAGTY